MEPDRKRPLARQLAGALTDAGYAVDCAADGRRAEFLGQTERYDAVVLDLGLPKVDGLTVLRRWREAGLAMPVLLLTARGSWHEKVQGIDSGADDYVSKPFRMEEVLARLRALIRRASGQVTPQLRCGPVVLDTRAARVTLDGAPVKLTGHEFRVLSYLMHHRGRVISQAELSEHISSLREATRLPWVLGPRSLDEVPDLLALAGEVERQAQLIGNLNAFALYTAAALLTMPFLLLVRIRSR